MALNNFLVDSTMTVSASYEQDDRRGDLISAVATPGVTTS
jgi:hypothetical protein